jgi:hypothetical protein
MPIADQAAASNLSVLTKHEGDPSLTPDLSVHELTGVKLASTTRSPDRQCDRMNQKTSAVQDADGMSLLAYAAGIGVARANMLLSVLLKHCALHSVGMLCCINSEPTERITPSGPAHTKGHSAQTQIVPFESSLCGQKVEPVDSHAQMPDRNFGAPTAITQLICDALESELSKARQPWTTQATMLDKLARQEAACVSQSWDWSLVVGNNSGCTIVNCLELAMLADFPSKLQVRFGCQTMVAMH